MIIYLILIPLAIGIFSFYLIITSGVGTKIFLWFKTASTGTLALLAIATVFLPGYDFTLSLGVAIALALCVIGDYLLELEVVKKSERFFLPGLIAFLLGHCAYLGTFFSIAGGFNCFAFAVVLAITGIYLFLILNKVDASLRIPVIMYGLVISFMVTGAFSLESGTISETRRLFIIAGSVLFYISDFQLAYNRFVKEMKHEALINWSFYFPGQVLLCCSLFV